MKQRGTRRKTRPRVESRLPLPPSLVILCTKTDEAHARVVTPIIRRGRIGKSARRVALRILSLSNRGSDSLRSLRRIYVVADCSSSSPTIVARIYWKVPLFFFFPFARPAFVHVVHVFPAQIVEDSNEDELIRFSPFFNFRAREWALVKDPRKRICVSIYIPDRHRPLLRGDEFNRCIRLRLLSRPRGSE